MKKIMFATGNPSKAKRFSKGLKKDDIEVLSLNDLNIDIFKKWNTKLGDIFNNLINMQAYISFFT